MKHLFVDYELAVKLKEKGFDEKCFTKYNPLDKKIQSISGFDLPYNFILAPLYQQVVDWFLEKHKIHIYLLLDGGTKHPCWRMCYTDMNVVDINEGGVEVYFDDEIGAIENIKEAWDYLINFILKELI